MRTFSPRPRDIERRWYVVDADGAVLGRLASQVATILRGKHKPIYAPHADTGDHVIVVNAKGVRLSGGKESKKVYYRHSGYPGGLRTIGYETLLSSRPALAVEKAIGGMLPKNRLGRQMLKKLSVYEGAEHPHQAQKPVELGAGQFPRWEGLPKPPPAPPAHEESKPSARKDAARPASRAKRAAAAVTGPARRSASGGKRATAGRVKAAPRAAQARRRSGGRAAAEGSQAEPATAGQTAASEGSARSASAGRSSSGASAAGAKKKASVKDEKPKRAPRRAKKES